MLRRIAAVLFLVVGAYVATVALTIGVSVVNSLFRGGWLGLEPELLIPVGIGAVSALLLRLGVVLWRQEEHP
jgi:hypothetical protein